MRLTEYFAVRQGQAKRRLTHLDARKVYRVGGLHPNSTGPLDRRYDPAGLTRRQRAAGRMTQLIVLMRRAYDAGDRAAYDRLIKPFDAAAKVIEGKGWGLVCRELSFPEWTNA